MANNDQHPTSNIQIEIGTLALHGFAPAQRHQIGAAVERELARLVGERGWPTAQLQRSERGQPIEIGANAPAPHVGTQIARAIYLQCGGSFEEQT